MTFSFSQIQHHMPNGLGPGKELIITELIPRGEPPADFINFHMTVVVNYGEPNQAGTVTASKRVAVPAADLDEAFANAPAIFERTTKEIETEMRVRAIASAAPPPKRLVLPNGSTR